MDYQHAEQHIKKILSNKKSPLILQQVVNFLYETFDYYNWIGIYVVRGNKLALGPWKGKFATEHTQIPIGTGICGSAAQSGETEIVDDVSKDDRYLSCFISTRSEIVISIKKNNVVVGEIDIDSDAPAAFDHKDAVFLEKVADMLSKHI